MTIAPKFARRGRELLPGQIAQLIVIDKDAGTPAVIFEAEEVIEAPNWTPDGKALVFNAGGELWICASTMSAWPSAVETADDRSRSRPVSFAELIARPMVTVTMTPTSITTAMAATIAIPESAVRRTSRTLRANAPIVSPLLFRRNRQALTAGVTVGGVAPRDGAVDGNFMPVFRIFSH